MVSKKVLKGESQTFTFLCYAYSPPKKPRVKLAQFSTKDAAEPSKKLNGDSQCSDPSLKGAVSIGSVHSEEKVCARGSCNI